jgi:hypothetical protein
MIERRKQRNSREDFKLCSGLDGRFTGILLLFILGTGLYSCIGPVPVDVVMIDNELFFVLEEEQEIGALRVIAATDRKKFGTGEYIKPLWAISHDLTTRVEKREYPKLKLIKYGQKFAEFPMVEGPAPLQKNVEYEVAIKMGNKFAGEVFIITSDNKVIMPRRGEIVSNKKECHSERM